MTSKRLAALIKAADLSTCFHLLDNGDFCFSPGPTDNHTCYDHQFVSLADLLREVAGMESIYRTALENISKLNAPTGIACAMQHIASEALGNAAESQP